MPQDAALDLVTGVVGGQDAALVHRLGVADLCGRPRKFADGAFAMIRPASRSVASASLSLTASSRPAHIAGGTGLAEFA